MRDRTAEEALRGEIEELQKARESDLRTLVHYLRRIDRLTEEIDLRRIDRLREEIDGSEDSNESL